MNPHKYFVSADLISNPLCGIDTYKDILNLATGQITRAIKKLVLTGDESWIFSVQSGHSGAFLTLTSIGIDSIVDKPNGVCSHYPVRYNNLDGYARIMNSGTSIRFFDDLNAVNRSTWMAFLSDQYTAGTPLTVWYVLAQPETEQITVPSGLSETVEGTLIQDGTPTPEAPIYPTANTAKGWYDINAYKRSVLVWDTDTAYERSDGSWT